MTRTRTSGMSVPLCHRVEAKQRQLLRLSDCCFAEICLRFDVLVHVFLVFQLIFFFSTSALRCPFLPRALYPLDR